MALTGVIESLRKRYGRPAPPPVTDPFELILFENVAYLVDDKTRLAVWRRLKKEIGVNPAEILQADPAQLARVIKEGGMRSEMRAEKLRKAARIALDSWDGDLRGVLKVDRARTALKKFPGIGDPGADKILMVTRTQPVLALESNGLRALLRLGYGEASQHYAAMYKSVQESISREIKADFDWLIAAHQLLRLHGQTLCKRTAPLCSECPMAPMCPSSQPGLFINSEAKA